MDESWVVQIEATSDERGRVYLELASKYEMAEAARGVALLRTIVQ